MQQILDDLKDPQLRRELRREQLASDREDDEERNRRVRKPLVPIPDPLTLAIRRAMR